MTMTQDAHFTIYSSVFGTVEITETHRDGEYVILKNQIPPSSPSMVSVLWVVATVSV